MHETNRCCVRFLGKWRSHWRLIHSRWSTREQLYGFGKTIMTSHRWLIRWICVKSAFLWIVQMRTRLYDCNFVLPGVAVWLRSLLLFETLCPPVINGTANFDVGIIRVWCQVTVFRSDFDASHGIDQRRIWLSASINEASPFTSPAAASDQRLWPFNGNSGKFSGLREHR